MDKATAEKIERALQYADDRKDSWISGAVASNVLADEVRRLRALTHPPVEAKPQGDARECWACWDIEYKYFVMAKNEQPENPKYPLGHEWVKMSEVHPIEGKGSAPECSHQNARQFNYTDDRICDDCHKIFSPKIRPFLPDPPCQYCNKNMVYGDHHPYCGTCGRWEPISSRVPPDAPANHIPDTNKMAPPDAKPKEEGDKCRFSECDGEYGYRPVENCRCHISPPCHNCVDNPLVCLDCGDDLPDADDQEAPADHLPDPTKVIQRDILDAIDKLECVIDECSAAHEHGDNTVDALPNQSAIIAFCPTHGLVSPCGACNLKNPLPIPEDMQSKQEDPLREILSPEMKEYRNLFFSAEASFRNGYMCGVSDMEIVSLGNKPPGEDERLKVFLSSLKSWEPAPEDMQSKAADPLYDKSAEFRAGYLWGIGAAADHIVDMRDMIPEATESNPADPLRDTLLEAAKAVVEDWISPTKRDGTYRLRDSIKKLGEAIEAMGTEDKP